MSDIEHIVRRIHKLETLLRKQYHAQGEGLEQLVDSCQERLPNRISNQLHLIAQVERELDEKQNLHVTSPDRFFVACKECEKELTPRSGRFVWRIAVSLMTIMTLIALAFYYLHWDILNQHVRW